MLELQTIKISPFIEKRRQIVNEPVDFITMSREDFIRTIQGEERIKDTQNHLNREKVLAIYHTNGKTKELSEMFGVSVDSVQKIKRKKTYKKYLSAV